MNSLDRRRHISLTLALSAVVILGVLPGPRARATSEPIEILGKLPDQLPAADRQRGVIVSLDAARRLMYYLEIPGAGPTRLIEYDIRPTIPRSLRMGTITNFPANVTAYQTAHDSRRDYLVFLDIYEQPVGTAIKRFNMKTYKTESPWNLEAAVPGFTAVGITYSPEDDRYYLAGDLSGSGLVKSGYEAFGLVPQGPLTVIVALDAASGQVAWIRPVPQCAQIMSSFGLGGFIGRSARRDALYFFCYSGGGSAGATIAYPAGTGLIRMGIAPKSGQNDAVTFPVEFFPVSGAYRGTGGAGVATLDRDSDRVFVQSLSFTTPGAWVFDGNISAWVGLIAAPDSDDNIQAINEGNGHYYISSTVPGGALSPYRYLLVSNARMTPPPQGDIYKVQIAGPVVTDPKSKRLFVPLAQGKDPQPTIYVLQDNTPDPEVPEPVDYDDLTSNIAEGASTVTAYSATSGGFGARALLAGGVGGARSVANTDEYAGPITQELINVYIGIVNAPIPAISPGDRGVYLGRVAGVDLRNSGAAASAQAVAPDSLTAGDIENLHNFVGGTPASPASEAVVWPWTASTCLDGAGERQEKDSPEPGGGTTIECDLAKNVGSATASVTAVSVGPLRIGSSSFSANATRDPVRGSITTSTAIAKHVELSLPGVGTLSIGRIVAIAKTFAHGRPGTAKVEYSRTISDVTLTDANGEETFSCAASCNPEEVADAVNGSLGAKVRMEVPQASTVATPRGAFAGVERSYRDFIAGQAQNNDSSQTVPALQLTFNNDAAGKSRVVVQFAGIQANSIYGISLLSDVSGGDGILPPPWPDGPPLIPGPLAPPPPDLGGGNGGSGRPSSSAGFRGALLLARTPKEIAVVMLIFCLMAGVVVSAYRRQMLVRHLEDEA